MEVRLSTTTCEIAEFIATSTMLSSSLSSWRAIGGGTFAVLMGVNFNEPGRRQSLFLQIDNRGYSPPSMTASVPKSCGPFVEPFATEKA